MRLVKYTLIGVALLLLGIQFVRPERTNPAATNPLSIDDATVESILRTSCFDCHSNETRWPWYSEIAPMSWKIAEHIEHGREHMNFSDWNDEKALKRFEEICEEIEDGEMPLKGYLPFHPDARLSADQITSLCSWSGARALSLGGAAH